MSTKGYLITFGCLVMLVILLGSVLIPIYENNNSTSAVYTDGAGISVASNVDTLIFDTNGAYIQGMYDGTAQIGDYTLAYTSANTTWSIKQGDIVKASFISTMVKVGYFDGRVYFNSYSFEQPTIIDRIRIITPTNFMTNSYQSYSLSAQEVQIPNPIFTVNPQPHTTTYPDIEWDSGYNGIRLKGVSDGTFDLGNYLVDYIDAIETWTIYDMDMNEIASIEGDTQVVGWKDNYAIVGSQCLVNDTEIVKIGSATANMFDTDYYQSVITVNYVEGMQTVWTADLNPSGEQIVAWIEQGTDAITFTHDGAKITAALNGQGNIGGYGFAYNSVTDIWTFYLESDPSTVLGSASGSSVKVGYKDNNVFFNSDAFVNLYDVNGIDMIKPGMLGTSAYSETMRINQPNTYANVFVFLAIISFLAFAVMIPTKWIN